jgi:hypothetical protein
VIPLPARDLSPAANGLCGLAAQFDVLHFHMGLHHFPLFRKSAAHDDRQFCGYRPARASSRSAHPHIVGAWRLFRIPRANLLREIDYVTAPIAPELLRAKVRVFVELYRLRNDLKERVRVRTAELAESEARYRSLVEDANDIVAKLDLDFYFTTVNRLVVAPKLKYDNGGLRFTASFPLAEVVGEAAPGFSGEGRVKLLHDDRD